MDEFDRIAVREFSLKVKHPQLLGEVGDVVLANRL
jgi:hypothetical protein